MLQIGTDEAWLWVAVELIQYTNKFLDLHLKTYEYDSCWITLKIINHDLWEIYRL